jgi:IS4 transposase
MKKICIFLCEKNNLLVRVALLYISANLFSVWLDSAWNLLQSIKLVEVYGGNVALHRYVAGKEEYFHSLFR